MNCITITGNITKDAEVRDVAGTRVCNFSIAENRKVKGEKVTTYYDCALWGKRGELVAPYLTKGGQVTVIGQLEPETRDGKTYLKVRLHDTSLPARSSQPAAQDAEDF